eukprot:Nk52_evm26s252 gene=Nk52_evmTU26s252
MILRERKLLIQGEIYSVRVVCVLFITVLVLVLFREGSKHEVQAWEMREGWVNGRRQLIVDLHRVEWEVPEVVVASSFSSLEEDAYYRSNKETSKTNGGLLFRNRRNTPVPDSEASDAEADGSAVPGNDQVGEGEDEKDADSMAIECKIDPENCEKGKHKDSTKEQIKKSDAAVMRQISKSTGGSDITTRGKKQYSYTAYLGFSNQKALCAMDTGSWHTWITSEDCSSDACKVRERYGLESFSFDKADKDVMKQNQEIKLQYMTSTPNNPDGSVVKGKVTFLTVYVPYKMDFGLKNRGIIAVNKMGDYPWTSHVEFNCVAGMSYSYNRTKQWSIVESLQQAGYIDRAEFSLVIKGNEGALIFGEPDPKYFVQDSKPELTIQKSPTRKNTYDFVWVKHEGTYFGDKYEPKKYGTILDSGASHIAVPLDIWPTCQEFMKKASKVINSIGCGGTLADKLPKFRVNLEGSIYTLTGDQYVKDSGNGECNILFTKSSKTKFVLGLPFLRSFHATFDYGSAKVKLSQLKPSYREKGEYIPPQTEEEFKQNSGQGNDSSGQNPNQNDSDSGKKGNAGSVSSVSVFVQTCSIIICFLFFNSI